MWSFYTDNACEVYPDGSSACGVKSMKASFEQFKAMLESKPSWTMAAPKVTLLSNDVALILCDVTSDIKLKGGQQIGGKTKFSAILQKVKGNWLLAFDSQTPIMQMPGAGN
jgi:ketosteroid isomerase-like protein